MDKRAEVGEFLATRRARITPEQVGLPVYDASKRRVAGLRRQEVATLAGLSVDYYTQLERGKAAGVSESVLDAIARALQLDDAERSHLFDLQRSNTPSAARSRPRRAKGVRPALQQMVDGMGTPAFIRNERQDLVCGNRLAHAFYSVLHEDFRRPDPTSTTNFVRFCFLDERAQDFYADWEQMADGAVNLLRTDAGRSPLDRGISDLVGELSTRSDAFRVRWARHNVRLHHSGTKSFCHPVVGLVEIQYETMPLPADPGLVLVIYTAQPGSPSADALSLLGSWAADEPAVTTDETTATTDV